MKRLLHFGPGNFCRAHLAEYVFDAGGWRIDVVGLRRSTVIDGLAAQVGGYALAVQGQAARRIDVIDHALCAPDDPARVLDLVTGAEVVSATVTEKGYHLGPDGQLDMRDPVIAEELRTGRPASLIGYLAHGLAQRDAPVTVLSCDNRPGNGDALGAAVMAFAQTAGLGITCDVAFPNAMVDRITPATTDALRAQIGDPMAVACEPFKEWVIEDRFATSRPDWPGVQWVNDVAPHELRKLRMLNGAHSFLAYAGACKGYQFVHEAIADADLRRQTRSLMKEAARTLPESVRGQAPVYRDALIQRFENPHLNHALRQIAMDGTQKLPYRIVAPLRELGPNNAPTLLSALRAWIRFCRQENAAAKRIDDPQAALLAEAQEPSSFLALIEAGDLGPFIAE